jgi:excisionase family DNA binding protein
MSPTKSAPIPEKLAFTIAEAATVASLGQTSLYRAIREKRLIAKKYGTRTVITRADLAKFLETLPATADPATRRGATSR